MRRREFIQLLSGAAIAWPAQADAQKAAVPVIGYLSSKGEAAETGILAGVRKGLGEQGFVEGRNVAIEYRWSEGEYERLPKLAADLAHQKVDLIATSGLPATLAAKAATSTIPIVFRLAVDPVAFKLAQRFDRPGGNLTGVTMMFDPLTPKKLQLLHELVSDVSIGLLVNPKNQNAASHKAHADAAAKALGLRLTILTAGSGAEIGPAFEHAKRGGLRAILVGDDPLFDVESARLVGRSAAGVRGGGAHHDRLQPADRGDQPVAAEAVPRGADVDQPAAGARAARGGGTVIEDRAIGPAGVEL